MSATLLAGAALDAGSMAMNSMAQKRMDAARATAIANQRTAQATLDTQIAAKNADALGQYTGFADKTAGAQSQLGALYNSHNIGQPGSTAPAGIMPTSSNTDVQQADAAESAKAAAFAQQQGSALAALDAPGSALQTAGLARGRDQQQIGILDNFKTGEASTLPFALDAANQQGAGLKTMADLFRGGGQIATSIGLQNAFTPTSPVSAAAAPVAAAKVSSLPFFASGSPGSAFSLR